MEHENSKKKKRVMEDSEDESTIFHKNKINPSLIHHENRQKCQ